MQRELVLRAQQGDIDAYSTLTESSTGRLYATARLILRDPEQAADAVQDALLQAWVDLKGLRDPDRFDAWLRRVLVRTCYSAARKHRHRLVVEVPLAPEREPATVDAHDAFLLRDQLDRAFTRLSLDHRTVIVLVHFLGLTHAETAATIGVPLGTVQSRLNRATQAMRAAVEADERSQSHALEPVR